MKHAIKTFLKDLTDFGQFEPEKRTYEKFTGRRLQK